MAKTGLTITTDTLARLNAARPGLYVSAGRVLTTDQLVNHLLDLFARWQAIGHRLAAAGLDSDSYLAHVEQAAASWDARVAEVTPQQWRQAVSGGQAATP